MKISPLILHFAYWMLYLAFKINHEYVWIVANYPDSTPRSVFLSAIIAQSLMLISKLGFAYWLDKKWLSLRYPTFLKALLLLFGFLVTLVIYRLIILYMVLPWAYGDLPESQPLFSLERVSSATIDILLAAGIYIAIMLFARYEKTKKEQQQLQQDKISTELQLLKSQTNPHFLFNTLNSIYVLARKQADNTAEAIMHLSNMMRFVLYETDTKRIALSKEVDIINDYVNLEELRFGKRLKLDISLSGDTKNLLISPMLLVSIVENAFKHGAEKEGIVEITIDLQIDLDQINFIVGNSTKEQTFKEGLGLRNLKRQLDIQYPDHYISTQIVDGFFIVELELCLNEQED